jgi:hypothetical protein
MSIDLTGGGSITVIPAGDRELLEVTTTSEIGDSVVQLTPHEAVAVGSALLSWGMGQVFGRAAQGMVRAARSMADALDMSERIAP